ncbi:cell division protein FtsQ/DivIB [Erythrobacter dokdonensis]|jgi:cell division protein FtsQ|uniref:Cell division protein FtsQ n=1 Tax=Erythrobacter dokdonensis DSW-74 TaxID=1300349 RepID=A0A1A7BCB4_9SPHN|nr:FtsQ-type POTRA domain-containing protein [Erythrobacter dokdonensis]MEE4316665.1 FtsQ-type POTRA domain-containing protein [Erythrobacter sp.]OBV10139.1 Cell division protein FtsQ [Erythrobacter dokdonensis DSW-74]
MAQQIRRNGSTGVRRAAKAQSRAVTARKAKGSASGFIDWLMGLLPFSEEQWSRIWLAIIIGGAVGLAFIIASLAGVPAMAEAQAARIAADAGFEVKGFRVTGTERMDEGRVYALIADQLGQPMPQVDPAEIRARLGTELPWVKDARVSIQLPHTLAIDIVERKPHAVLEKPDRLVLIDVGGVELETVAPAKAKQMLRLAGPGAGQQAARLDTLLAAAPALRPQIEAAEWVGNRRWNLTFKTGQLLALPEGDTEAATALVKFARLDGQNRLIGGKVLAFDMRSPPRLYMRLPDGEREARKMAAAGGAL